MKSKWRNGGEEASLILGDEPPDGTIVGPLSFGREKTGGEFLHPPMIRDTFTTFPFPWAGIISTVALCLVLL
jgi:hypothetical protein